MVTGDGELWGWHDFQRVEARSRVVADDTQIRRRSTSKLAKKITFLNEFTGSVHVTAASMWPIKRCDPTPDWAKVTIGLSCHGDGPAPLMPYS